MASSVLTFRACISGGSYIFRSLLSRLGQLSVIVRQMLLVS